jgi:ACS family hexuronate transporter-like MFS transporter
VPWIAANWGWDKAFIIVGGVGFLWLFFWLYFYEKPEKQKRLSAAELEYINSGDEIVSGSGTVANGKVRWFKLLEYKQTWAFAFGKFMTDGVWWFFLFWLPGYLKDNYGIEGTDIMIPLTVLYSLTMFGSIGGGWFPMYFIRKGYQPYDGRMKAMLLIALVPLVVLAAQPLGHISFWVPVILIGIGASAHQAWSANIFTTVSDMFPKKAIGSVVGIGGMAGGFGGVLVTKVGGWIFDAYRNTGIVNSWAEAKAAGLGNYLSNIQGLNLVSKHGDKIDLNYTELSKLPKEVAAQLQSVDATMFNQLLQIQKPLVQVEMVTGYTIMFAFCAVAYLIAWGVMKALVPKYKPITDL